MLVGSYRNPTWIDLGNVYVYVYIYIYVSIYLKSGLFIWMPSTDPDLYSPSSMLSIRENFCFPLLLTKWEPNSLPDFVLMPSLNKPLCPDLKGDRNFYLCMILKWQAVTYINFLKFYQGFILVQLRIYCLIVSWCQAVSGWKCSVGEAASAFEDLFI